jgi:hypothetical protein
MLLFDPSLASQNQIYGHIALRYGYLSEQQLEHCQRAMAAPRQEGLRPDLGETCMMYGYLTEDERQRIATACAYYFARQEDKLLGKIGLRYRFFSPKHLKQNLSIQEHLYLRGNPRVPRLLGLLLSNETLSSEKLLKFLKTIQHFSLRATPAPVSPAPSPGPAPAKPAAPDSDPERPEQWQKQDPRASRRFPVADALVNVALRDLFSPLRKRFPVLDQLPIRAPVNLLAPLVNLSTTGLQALSPKALSIGQQVELDLHIPIFPAPLETRGRVRWTAPGKDGYRVGVMFTGLNARSEAYLKELDANPFLCTIGQSAFEVVRMGA